jgi:hypothetical protein
MTTLEIAKVALVAIAFVLVIYLVYADSGLISAVLATLFILSVIFRPTFSFTITHSSKTELEESN